MEKLLKPFSEREVTESIDLERLASYPDWTTGPSTMCTLKLIYLDVAN